MSYIRGARMKNLSTNSLSGQQKKRPAGMHAPPYPFRTSQIGPPQVCVLAQAFSECLQIDQRRIQFRCQPEKKYISAKKVKKTIVI